MKLTLIASPRTPKSPSRPRCPKKIPPPARKKSGQLHGKKSLPLGEQAICRIVQLRNRNPGMHTARLAEIYRDSFGSPLAENTIKRILHSCGLPDPVVKSAELAGGVFPDAKVNAPNDVWTVEFKTGWQNRSGIPEPIIVRDEFTRFVIAARMLPDACGTTMRAFFEELFRSHGLPGTICCAKSQPFGSNQSLLGLTKVSAWWLALGISVDWKRPGHTRECRWIERPRMQLGYAWRLQNSQERQEELDRWREGFNKSTHVSLKNVSPAKAYGRKSVQGSLPVVLLDYPGLERRRVGKGGGIRLNGLEHFLSTALAGWDVALKEIADGRLEVRFAQLSLGILDPEKVEFIPAIT
ncbi:MAG: hypothetical protein ACOYM3_17065 [Terrimicrobiaceae bacterium]